MIGIPGSDINLPTARPSVIPEKSHTMEKRASIPVSLPRDNPTVSYWQDPPDEIADLRSTSQLPQTADVVVIGSGISGAAIAHNILLRAPDAKIVLLEARQACSGATGRNGNQFLSLSPFFSILRSTYKPGFRNR